jgi:hypothetical protein
MSSHTKGFVLGSEVLTLMQNNSTFQDQGNLCQSPGVVAVMMLK